MAALSAVDVFPSSIARFAGHRRRRHSPAPVVAAVSVSGIGGVTPSHVGPGVRGGGRRGRRSGGGRGLRVEGRWHRWLSGKDERQKGGRQWILSPPLAPGIVCRESAASYGAYRKHPTDFVNALRKGLDSRLNKSTCFCAFPSLSNLHR